MLPSKSSLVWQILELKEGLETIHESAFELCKALTGAFFPSTLWTIGDKAFARCYGLQTVEIASNSALNGFGALCFEDCTALVTIDIPCN